ncbi:MAG: nucleotidyl transferase AbiEii/AbiGii toxin family protein [Alphaproteobacteria bacterium]|nr:nucleotidyl transferase AbiEii/AbiGii toxin family protein [Alphaproteobacteria bacterium]
MIQGKIFQNLSRRLGIRAETLERDYVMNLILDAFAHCPSTQDTFFFKGGCCVHKCFSQHTFNSTNPNLSYFLNGRFSSDIDLTVTPDMMSTEKLTQAFEEVKEYVYHRHGLVIGQFSFPIHANNKQQIENRLKSNCRGIIHFEGPMYNKRFNSPAMKFDITADERVVFSPYKRLIFHPYSKEDEEIVLVTKTYTLRDIFAEKIRALFERCSPRDLYDLVILQSHPDLDESRRTGIGLSIIEKFILKQMDYNISMKRLETTQRYGTPLLELCRTSWENALMRQVASIPNYDDYIQQLPNIISFAQQCVLRAQKEIAHYNNRTPKQFSTTVHRLLLEQTFKGSDFQKQINQVLAEEKNERSK